MHTLRSVMILMPMWKTRLLRSRASAFFAVLFGVVCAVPAAGALPAFPGAEGAGAETVGGRGGRVIYVTNLQDSGPGSFRAAVEAGGPRVVMFKVSGVIELKSPVIIENPYLTIAGQSAPGDGICISGETVTINTEQVIVRYLRFRRGDLDREDDALNAVSSRGHIIIDHCSFSWGLDENVSFYRYMRNLPDGTREKNPIQNVTIQWSISSEALNLHNHAFGATWGGRNVSFHHNLFANNTARIPSIGWGDGVDFRNNVLFNWRHRTVDGGDATSRLNIVGNVYKPGPATNPGELQYRIARPEVFRNFGESKGEGGWYITDNWVIGNERVTADNWDGGVQFPGADPEDAAREIEKGRNLQPHPAAPITQHDAREAYELVLERAGAVLPRRDPVDTRIIREVRTGETTFGNGIINTPADVGGWPEYRSVPAPLDTDGDGMPDAWERRYGFDPTDPADGPRDADGDGYTNLEEYLNGTSPREYVDYSVPENNVNAFHFGARIGEEAAQERATADGGHTYLLQPGDFSRHIDYFNGNDPERVVNLVSNAESWEWLQTRIPFFEAPDATVEEIYYFRWWSLRKHLKQVGDYQAFTEFIELQTTASFIPPERTIASALGHHYRELRWLREQAPADSALDYWMVGNDGGPQGHFHRYSSWLLHSLWERAITTGDFEFLEERFDRLIADYRRWQEEKQTEEGLYWSHDVWDAMEESISGSRTQQNLRPTLNSYMYGNALAMAKLARRVGETALADELEAEAADLRRKVLDQLWNDERQFFEVRYPDGEMAQVREQIGFIPWYFHLPEPGGRYEAAWEQLVDPAGFWAPFGLTTAERRHPRFRSHGIGTCEWDGAIWPYATSQTLVALGNLLRDYPQAPVDAHDYLDAFVTYTRAQYFDGIPYIGEYQDEVSGYWLKGQHPRSYYYHHSTYADLLIEGIVGLRPQDDDTVVVDPLLPDGTWNWFALDGVRYRGHDVTIFWDVNGSRYGRGAGFHLLIDGQPAAHSETLGRLEAKLP